MTILKGDLPDLCTDDVTTAAKEAGSPNVTVHYTDNVGSWLHQVPFLSASACG